MRQTNTEGSNSGQGPLSEGKGSTALQPTGLMCELMAHPGLTLIRNPRPRFSWIVNDRAGNRSQLGRQILVSSSLATLDADQGDMWDSGIPDLHTSWELDDHSIYVLYAGEPLASGAAYYWKVRTWTCLNEASPWSEPQSFRTGQLTDEYTTPRYPLQTTLVEPVRVVKHESGIVFADFGRAAFGTVELTLETEEPCTVEVRLGEVAAGSSAIEQFPGGSRRFRAIPLPLKKGRHIYRVVIPRDQRNTGKAAVLMPEEIGEVLPFRYCEIAGAPAPLRREDVRQVVVTYPFDEGAATFKSSNRVLEDVWELCRYSMKATSFCGIYVDGDRERIPYEGDAYINQLGHYGCDREFTLARATHEYLMHYPTWPTEWTMHSVLIAWTDYLYTGDRSSIETLYNELLPRTLIELEREDGLLSTVDPRPSEDLLHRLHFDHERYIFDGRLVELIDWPQGERDGYVLMPINTVANAFHFRSLILMSRIADALGKSAEASGMRDAAARVHDSFNEKLFDAATGLYLDGEGTRHSSLHANLFPLAFGLVPEQRKKSVVEFIKSKGMACSVYTAHHLLEALYRAGEEQYALSLLTSTSERSWAHMVYDVGSTISLEAWDDRFKPNQDWNHAWGAAPANLIPRWLMGVRPVKPGFDEVIIDPRPGTLAYAEMTVPTIRGPIGVRFENNPEVWFHLEVELPCNMHAKVGLPRFGRQDSRVSADGRTVFGRADGDRIYVDGVGSGLHVFERG